MKRVMVESPFVGDLVLNAAYVKACIYDSLLRGEAPFASHVIYPHALDDTKPDERKWGIEAGYTWGEISHEIAIYTDLGMSGGMSQAQKWYQTRGMLFSYRSLLESYVWKTVYRNQFHRDFPWTIDPKNVDQGAIKWLKTAILNSRFNHDGSRAE